MLHGSIHQKFQHCYSSDILLHCTFTIYKLLLCINLTKFNDSTCDLITIT